LSFLDELNPQQREAVETTEGPVLILAGAGSGKTRVITFRIAYLIETLGVMPESILAVTFTNKAASEMAERVEKLVGGLSVAKPVISTFHSFCVRVLRRDIEALQVNSGGETIGSPDSVKDEILRLEHAIAERQHTIGELSAGQSSGSVTRDVSELREELARSEKELGSINRQAASLRRKIEEVERELEIVGCRILGVLYHKDGQTECIDVIGRQVPPHFRSRGPICDKCAKRRNRKLTVVFSSDDGTVKQYGSCCMEEEFHSDAYRLEGNAEKFRDLRRRYSDCENRIAPIGNNCDLLREQLQQSETSTRLRQLNEDQERDGRLADELRESLRRSPIQRKRIGLTKNFVIYDESDQQQVVKGIMRRMGLDDKQLTPRNVLSRISWAKNHMLDPQEIYLQSADPKMEKIAHVFEEYRKELRKANAMDFDDLLLEAMRLLKSVAAVREYYNRRFQYLLVDEYQDTNRPQYELMRLLAGAGHNVCAVGDEDQSIYSWRGADIRNILEFERDFPEAKIVRLEQNYRSTQNILEAASVVVANNVRRKGKNLWTSRQGGAKIGCYEAPDGENEALFAADTINKYIRSAGESGETPRAAVLYRTNSQSRLFEEAMRRYGLKYHVVGGFSFYERAEIKDLISYLKVIQNPDDSVSLLRAINTPARGIGKTTIETIERLALETGLSMWGAVEEAFTRQLLPARALAALKNFRDVIEDGRAMLSGKFRERVEEASDESTAEVRSALAGRSARPIQDVPTQASDPTMDETDFDPSNFSFDFEAHDLPEQGKTSEDARRSIDNAGDAEAELGDTSFSPDADLAAGQGAVPDAGDAADAAAVEGFRALGEAAHTGELLKFLIDRTRYIKILEAEDTPEAYSRIENLRELVNAAMDSKDRGETLDQFLDHAALVSDADQYDEGAQITLMTLHAAKGLEFPLVVLAGMEEGLFPHSRTMLEPDSIEEERRLCYVGMTRAMDTLILSRAVYRRRYGTDMPEASVPSRFLEEVPPQLVEEMGGSRRRTSAAGGYSSSSSSYSSSAGSYSSGSARAGRPRPHGQESHGPHYSYEDEDQSATWDPERVKAKAPTPVKNYNSIDNIAEFFASRGKKFSIPKMLPDEPAGKRGFRPGQKVKHPKYGEGTVYQREGDGEDAKITVQFPRFGLKKLVERYAQLEKA
jgi:DNA helicase-2/ATP-dependent DNA helicase PcrA